MNVALEIASMTVNGPYLLGDSFGVTLAGKLRFVPSSQTLLPVVNGLYHGLSLIQLSCALRWASWAASLASLILRSHCSSVRMSVALVG